MFNAAVNYHGPSSESNNGSFNARSVSVSALGSANENLCQSLFETPRREPEGSKPKELDYFAASGLLDDDFDDSILEQIDILVEQKSAEKAAEQQLDRICDEKVLNQSNIAGEVSLSSGCITVSVGLGNGHLLNSGVDLHTKQEEVDTSLQGLLNSNSSMPEEYLKYLQSLNDRQREAACTDISTPLMIVAGPGSGKVFYSMPFLVPLNVDSFVFPLSFFIFTLKLNCLFPFFFIIYFFISDIHNGRACIDAAQ